MIPLLCCINAPSCFLMFFILILIFFGQHRILSDCLFPSYLCVYIYYVQTQGNLSMAKECHSKNLQICICCENTDQILIVFTIYIHTTIHSNSIYNIHYHQRILQLKWFYFIYHLFTKRLPFLTFEKMTSFFVRRCYYVYPSSRCIQPVLVKNLGRYIYEYTSVYAYTNSDKSKRLA